MSSFLTAHQHIIGHFSAIAWYIYVTWYPADNYSFTTFTERWQPRTHFFTCLKRRGGGYDWKERERGRGASPPQYFGLESPLARCPICRCCSSRSDAAKRSLSRDGESNVRRAVADSADSSGRRRQRQTGRRERQAAGDPWRTELQQQPTGKGYRKFEIK